MSNFDPRAVPVAGTDAHLPALDPQHFGSDALRQRFAVPPAWVPDVPRDSAAPVSLPARAPAQAAVLVGIVERESPTVLLTERTATLSTHAGQVAFPGGRADPGDADVAATALREAWEEVGLDARHARVLGALPVYATVSGFVVTPVVALVAPDWQPRPNPGEVAAVFEVPLAYLMNPAHHRRHHFARSDGRSEWFSMPWTDPASGREHYIWGATAGMLRNLYRFLAS